MELDNEEWEYTNIYILLSQNDGNFQIFIYIGRLFEGEKYPFERV